MTTGTRISTAAKMAVKTTALTTTARNSQTNTAYKTACISGSENDEQGDQGPEDHRGGRQLTRMRRPQRAMGIEDEMPAQGIELAGRALRDVARQLPAEKAAKGVAEAMVKGRNRRIGRRRPCRVGQVVVKLVELRCHNRRRARGFAGASVITGENDRL